MEAVRQQRPAHHGGGNNGWTLISSVDNDEKLTGVKQRTSTYSCPTTDKYTYFRWEITSVGNPNENCVQASEFALVQAVPFLDLDGSTGTMTFKYGDKPTTDDIHTYIRVDQPYVDYPAWHNELLGGLFDKVIIDTSFQYYRPTTCRRWFADGRFLTSITGLENLRTDEVTDMSSMFCGCKNLYSLYLSYFCTSNVTDMSSMFSGCNSLLSLDLSSFNTSKVTDMGSMFYICNNLLSLDLSSFNTSNVTDMNSMFYECYALSELDLSSFNTSNVTDMSSMFSWCSSLRSLDLSSFNTSKVTDMSSMFLGCYRNLRTLDLSSFNTSNVTDMSSMFYRCDVLSSLDLSSFTTSNVTSMSGMFYDCNLLTLDLSTFNTSNVTDMSEMFSSCSQLRTIYVGSDFTTKSLNEDSDMFSDCYNLEGAIKYPGGDGCGYANYETGYLTKKVGTNGIYFIGAVGKPLTIVGKLNLYDKRTFDLYEDCFVSDASYTREEMNKEWGSLCLPYTLAVTDDLPCSFYTLKDMGDETILLTKVESDTIAAGQPVMIRRTADVSDLTFNNAPNARIVKAPKNAETGNRLMGTFSTMELTDDDSYFLANDEFRRVGDYRPAVTGVKLAQFRAYLQPEATGRASELRIGVSGETNDVETPQVVDQLNNEATEYYDLSGHRILNLRKGVNIVKTGDKVRKVIIK